MDFEKVVLESNKLSGTGQKLDEPPVRGQLLSKTVIGEDLRRAIVALRSVPKVNWSRDSFYENSNDGLDLSTEYIWRAIDLSGNSSFAADWSSAVKMNDGKQRNFLTNNGAPKLVAGQTQNPSEIMRKDSFTVASKRLDRTSDSKCQLVEQSTTSVQMSLFSRERRGKANDIGQSKSFAIPSSELAAPSVGDMAMKKPPPLPPKPSYLQKLRIEQPPAGKLSLVVDRTLGSGKNLRKSDTSVNGRNHDASDIYERSLDVLEKDDSDQDFEDLTSPRSESPECLLDELLDSVPAVEFDTPDCHPTSSLSVANNRETVRTKLMSFDNLGPKSNGAVGRHGKEDRKKKMHNLENKFTSTSSPETKLRPHASPLEHQRNIPNPSFKPVYKHIKPVTRHLDFSAPKKVNRPHTESPAISIAAPAIVASDKELTPEDIFEEIMDFLEARKDDHGKSSVQSPSTSSENSRDERRSQPDPGGRPTCDYQLENEWLSLYCDQTQADIQQEMLTNSRASKNTTPRQIREAKSTTNPDSSKSSGREEIFKSKQLSEPLPGTASTPDEKALPRSNTTRSVLEEMDFHFKNKPSPLTDEKILQSSNTTFLFPEEKTFHASAARLPSPESKNLPGPSSRLPSPEGKNLPGPSSRLPSPYGKALRGPDTRLHSTDGKVSISSQDTLQATVKRKPAAPLRETVQTTTFVKKDSMMQDIKIAPAIKSKPLAPNKAPQIRSNGFSVGNVLNSNAELKHLPTEHSDNWSGALAAESTAVPRDDNKRTVSCSDARIKKTESLIPGDDSISPLSGGIVTVITRESDLPGCDTYEEDMDLDLEIELSRNLDACTASDVECQSIDKLVTTESLLSSDTTAVRRPKKSNSLEVKTPVKLGEILAKKKVKKSRSIDNTAESVRPHRNEPVNGNQANVEIKKNTIALHTEDTDTAQEAGIHVSVEESANRHSKSLNNSETTRNKYPKYPKHADPLKRESAVNEYNEGAEITGATDGTSGSDNEDSYKQTIVRNVRSAEKENTTALQKQPVIQVLSEEVTSQEIVLKIAWPKQESKGNSSRLTETRKAPPFRELKLKRVMRISDLDSPLNVLPNVDDSQSPPFAVAQKSPNALRLEPKPPRSAVTLESNDGRGVTPANIDTVATRNTSQIVVEYVNKTNGRSLERISSDSAIDVQKAETVKVLRVPMAAVHKVQDIKEAVETVGSTILGDLQRQPKKRNVRVTCEAVESKSRASLHDQDVTVIRNTIVDTYRPRKPAIVFSAGPTNSVHRPI